MATAITVVDLCGLFKQDIIYCECPGAGVAWEQFFQMGYLPASTSQPATVFTFRVMDYFALDKAETHAPAMAFFSKICRCTNGLFPQDVQVQYPYC